MWLACLVAVLRNCSIWPAKRFTRLWCFFMQFWDKKKNTVWTAADEHQLFDIVRDVWRDRFPRTQMRVDFGVWGLVITSFLFYIPSFILLNVGFKCRAAIKEFIEHERVRDSFCVKLDEELAIALIACGFVFLTLGIGSSAFTVLVFAESKRSLSSEDVSEDSRWHNLDYYIQRHSKDRKRQTTCLLLVGFCIGSK